MAGEKRICSVCVSDDYLKEVIDQSQEIDQVCDYCGSVRPTIDMLSLAMMCDDVIENFFEVSSATPAVIHFGRTPEGNDLRDVLDSLLAAPSAAVDHLVELLGELWFDWSSHENKYGEDDPWFVEKSSLQYPLSKAWKQMEESLRYEARFINPSAANLLEEVFGSILEDRTHQGDEVVVELGIGGAFDTLFRARVFQTPNSLEDAFEHPERHFGPPPPGKGAAGRMNAKGLPVFYGATKRDIAISEVRPPVGSLVVVAQFKVIRPIRVLDLSQLRSVRLKPRSSVFDPDTVKEATRRDFLRELTQRIAMPVVPELEDHHYVVTQTISDFLAMHPKLNLDGILFPSAQHRENEGEPPGSNVILFNKASVVLYADESNSNRTKAYLYEYDEDSPHGRIQPTLWTEAREVHAQDSLAWQHQAKKLPALKLDLDAIAVHEIIRVKYETWPYEVRNYSE